MTREERKLKRQGYDRARYRRIIQSERSRKRDYMHGRRLRLAIADAWHELRKMKIVRLNP